MEYRIAACDIGKATASFAVAAVNAKGKIIHEDIQTISHHGRIRDAFQHWYEKQKIWTCRFLAATGVYAEKLARPAMIFPEDTCQEAWLEDRSGRQGVFPDTMNLVSVGAGGYSVLSRMPSGNEGTGIRYTYQFAENDKCSSGTGETLNKLVSRFGYTLEEADAMARDSREMISITARCSVFAKSEMTHYANQGKSRAALFKGYFNSIAGNAMALVQRNQNPGAVYLIGGCTRLDAFVEAFKRVCDTEVSVADDPMTFEVMGCLRMAADNVLAGNRHRLPRRADELIAEKQHRFTVLPAAKESRNRLVS